MNKERERGDFWTYVLALLIGLGGPILTLWAIVRLAEKLGALK